MIRKYTVQISEQQQFPFQSANPLFLEHQVKLTLQVSPPYTLNFYRKQIHKSIQLQYINPSLVHLIGVIEYRNMNKFSLSYEPVPFSFKQVFNSNMNVNLPHVKQKIRYLFSFLLENGVFPKIQTKNIGFTRDLQLKYFLMPNFKQVNKQKFSENIQYFNKWIYSISKITKQANEAYRLRKEDQICGDLSKLLEQDTKNIENNEDTNSLRFSQKDFKNYNSKFQKKITQIQNKIFRLKGKNKGARSEKHFKNKISSKQKNSNFSDDASDFSSTHSSSLEKQKNKEQQLNKIRHSFNHNIHSNLQNFNQKSQTGQNFCNKKQGQSKQKMTNSWIFEQENKKQQLQKHHKSSWGDELKKQHKSSWGDYSTSNPNESQKQFFLKRRISTALQKSQYALKVYENYQSNKCAKRTSKQMTNKKKE